MSRSGGGAGGDGGSVEGQCGWGEEEKEAVRVVDAMLLVVMSALPLASQYTLRRCVCVCVCVCVYTHISVYICVS